jgi:hypothetical protein
MTFEPDKALSILFVGSITAKPPEPTNPRSRRASVLETKISLGEVSGRIDHQGIDLNRERAFVAELGNNRLGCVATPCRLKDQAPPVIARRRFDQE